MKYKLLTCYVSLIGVLLGASGCGGGGGGEPTSTSSTSVQSTNTAAASNPALNALSSPACGLQYSASDFKAASVPTPDPLRPNQWHLQNAGQSGATAGEDINLTGAWAITQGAGVRVAIIDNSLETIHADLVANVAQKGSYSYRSEQAGGYDPLPCYTTDTHGTSVAGVVAATGNNGVGGTGVAPAASLVGYNALATNTDADLADALTRDLASNSIYNSSWGSVDDSTLHTVSELHAQAIEHGTRNGRAGKGAIYIFAAGNGGCVKLVGETTPCQPDNANFDGYLTPMGALVVGSVNRHGKAPAYAEPGANILVNAPGGDTSLGITTTAIRGGYTQSFAGSSAATPMVSGVAALLLAVNPTLTWRDVRIILARTARKNDATEPSWKPGKPIADGLTPSHSHRYGFGTVDATAAVTAARQWTSVGGSDQLRSCGPFQMAVDADIPDDGQALARTMALGAAQCGISQLEHVAITVDIEHDYSGDLAITLTSPLGQDSELARPRRCRNGDRETNTCGQFANWRFGSVRHLDEPSQGNWTLTVQDTQTGKTGRLRSWSLTLSGR